MECSESLRVFRNVGVTEGAGLLALRADRAEIDRAVSASADVIHMFGGQATGFASAVVPCQELGKRLFGDE